MNTLTLSVYCFRLLITVEVSGFLIKRLLEPSFCSRAVELAYLIIRGLYLGLLIAIEGGTSERMVFLARHDYSNVAPS